MSGESYRKRKGLPCSYCRESGHQLPTCQEYLAAKKNVEKLEAEHVELPEDLYYVPILDVVRDPGCVRAVLSAYGVSLSGRKDENVRSLEALVVNLERDLRLHKVSAQE
jgi:hypothetical protein